VSGLEGRPAVEHLTRRQVRVLDKDFTWWEHAHDAVNAEYIGALSTRYPHFKLRSYAALFRTPGEGDEGGEQRDVAGLAIRQAYFELLETTVALWFAYLQAPDAVPVWMLRYKNLDLNEAAVAFAGGVNLPGSELGERLTPDQFAAGVIAALRHDGKPHPENIAAPAREALSLALRHLLIDFNDKDFQAEYNAIKHGHRGEPGGVQVLFNVLGEPEWDALIDSGHATTFYKSEEVQGKRDIVLHRRTTTYSVEHIIIRAEVALAVLNLIIGLLVARANLKKQVPIQLPSLPVVQAAWSVESAPYKMIAAHVYQFRTVAGAVVGQREIVYSFQVPVAGDVAGGDGVVAETPEGT